jgi:hypothetical protein
MSTSSRQGQPHLSRCGLSCLHHRARDSHIFQDVGCHVYIIAPGTATSFKMWAVISTSSRQGQPHLSRCGLSYLHHRARDSHIFQDVGCHVYIIAPGTATSFKMWAVISTSSRQGQPHLSRCGLSCLHHRARDSHIFQDVDCHVYIIAPGTATSFKMWAAMSTSSRQGQPHLSRCGLSYLHHRARDSHIFQDVDCHVYIIAPGTATSFKMWTVMSTSSRQGQPHLSRCGLAIPDASPGAGRPHTLKGVVGQSIAPGAGQPHTLKGVVGQSIAPGTTTSFKMWAAISTSSRQGQPHLSRCGLSYLHHRARDSHIFQDVDCHVYIIAPGTTTSFKMWAVMSTSSRQGQPHLSRCGLCHTRSSIQIDPAFPVRHR